MIQLAMGFDANQSITADFIYLTRDLKNESGLFVGSCLLSGCSSDSFAGGFTSCHIRAPSRSHLRTAAASGKV
jgi:hypothetical protein